MGKIYDEIAGGSWLVQMKEKMASHME